MGTWAGFFGLTGGAAASLLGLLFVAVSIGISSESASERLVIRHFTRQAYQNYMITLVVSAILLMPDIPTPLLGKIMLGEMIATTGWAALRAWRDMRGAGSGHNRRDDVLRYIPSAIGIALALYAAIRLLAGDREGLYYLAGGLLTLLASAAATSWNLLLTLVRGNPGGA